MKAFDFFFAHAGYSYSPDKESEFAGRVRCALELARAEARSFAEGLRFEWSIDEYDSSEFSDDPEPWELWALTVRDADDNVLASLGGIDFGRSGSPFRDPYGRVVEAELALEALALE